MKSNQQGFTAVELIIAVGAAAALLTAGAAAYVIVHFISKFW